MIFTQADPSTLAPKHQAPLPKTRKTHSSAMFLREPEQKKQHPGPLKQKKKLHLAFMVTKWDLMRFYGDLMGSNGIYFDIPSGNLT
jgi:hypothetical protein